MKIKTFKIIILLASIAIASFVISSPISPSEKGVSVAVLSRVDGRLEVKRYHASDQLSAQEMVKSFLERPDVVTASIPGEVAASASSLGLDELRKNQWALTRLDFDKVNALASGKGITVAVVDTGVDASHEDLTGQVLPGYDVLEPGGDGHKDPNGHGTHVAGIIAAKAGNSLGVAGLAPEAKILPVRALDETGYGDDAGIAEGVLWAADHGASVINLSLGSDTKDPVLAAAVADVIQRKIVVVAASGNGGLEGNAPSYPAALPGVVAVSASSFGDQLAMFSTTGSYVSLSAPGVSILSTWPGNNYVYESGTSMATPYVSAAFALLESAGKSPSSALSLLESSATDLGQESKDASFGYGLVDPYAALTDGKPRVSDPFRVMPTLPDLPQLPSLDIPKPQPLPPLPPLTLPSASPLPSPDASLKLNSTLVIEKIEKGKSSNTFTITLSVGKVKLGSRELRIEKNVGSWSEIERVATDPFGSAKVSLDNDPTSQWKVRFDGDRVATPSELLIATP